MESWHSLFGMVARLWAAWWHKEFLFMSWRGWRFLSHLMFKPPEKPTWLNAQWVLGLLVETQDLDHKIDHASSGLIVVRTIIHAVRITLFYIFSVSIPATQFLHLSKFCIKQPLKALKGAEFNVAFTFFMKSSMSWSLFLWGWFHFKGMGESQLAWDQVVYMDGCSQGHDSSGSSLVSWQSNVILQTVERTAQIFHFPDCFWKIWIIIFKLMCSWSSIKFGVFDVVFYHRFIKFCIFFCIWIAWLLSTPWMKRQIWGRT